MEGLESRRLLATVSVFPLPAGTTPFEIVAAPDGNLWFVDLKNSAIDMFNPTTQATTKFPLPGRGGTSRGLAVGPDGNLWFADDQTNSIGMIDLTTHAITEFPLPTPHANPEAITAGPDGNLWFTEATAEEIGSINPTTHAISVFSLNTYITSPYAEVGIAAGPDGNIWFTGAGGNDDIGMFNLTTDALTRFAVPTSVDSTADITTGPDGNLWFTDELGTIGMIDPTTGALTQFPLPAAPSGSLNRPIGITTGPDGNIWFTNEYQNSVGLIDPTTHTITEFPVPVDVPNLPIGSGPFEITTGPGGNLWFTLPDSGEIGEINLNPPSTGPTGSGGGTGPVSPPPANTPPASGTSTGSGGGTVSDPGLTASGPPDSSPSTDSSGSGNDGSPTSTPAPETPTVPVPSTASTVPAGGAAPVAPPAANVPPVPGLRFDFAIGLTRSSVPDAAGHEGAISLTLGSKPRRDVLAVATGKGRVAVSGLTLRRFDHGAGFRIFADANARVAATRGPREPALPHLLATEKTLTAGKGNDRHVDGFRVVLAEAFAPAVARGMAHRDAADIPDGGRPGLVDLEVSYLTSLGAGSLELHARARVAPTGQVVVIART